MYYPVESYRLNSHTDRIIKDDGQDNGQGGGQDYVTLAADNRFISNDVAAWDDNGVLTMTGRTDDVVKVRGFRVSETRGCAVLPACLACLRGARYTTVFSFIIIIKIN